MWLICCCCIFVCSFCVHFPYVCYAVVSILVFGMRIILYVCIGLCICLCLCVYELGWLPVYTFCFFFFCNFPCCLFIMIFYYFFLLWFKFKFNFVVFFFFNLFVGLFRICISNAYNHRQWRRRWWPRRWRWQRRRHRSSSTTPT